MSAIAVVLLVVNTDWDRYPWILEEEVIEFICIQAM